MDPTTNAWEVFDKSLPSLLTNNEVIFFQDWICRLKDWGNRVCISEVLNSIPIVEGYPSYLPAICFSVALQRYNGCWSTVEVLSAYTKIWRTLPEAEKFYSPSDSTFFIRRFEEHLQNYIKCPVSLFNSSDSPALIDPASKRVLSHEKLSTFIRYFRLPLQKSTFIHKKPTVVLALPNGYLLGLANLAVSSYYTAAPVNTAGGPIQFRSDVELIRPQAILVLEQDIGMLELNTGWAVKDGIKILIVAENAHCTFDVREYQKTIADEQIEQCSPNKGNDLALILLTSGTSGIKKVVPVTTMSLLIGISCVVTSWGLSSHDRCINMMPLNHVGGLVRNLFAPVFSGGSTVLCSLFDPNLFWDLMEDGQGTWYYASPSMHTSILAEKEFRDLLPSQYKLRLVCNAAGGLLPALAKQLREVFNCAVLPSYGMTECMPISTPPLDYTLDRPGTSGVPCGPEVSIMGDNDAPLPAKEIGRICVRGGPTFMGYLQTNELSDGSLSKTNWFDTGDLGYLDCDGYLYLTGRVKEVINRGGEIISPFEVEEAITNASQTPSSSLYGQVKAVLAFSVPHEVLQEVVGVIIIPNPKRPRPGLQALHSALQNLLHPSKLPAIVVYMDALPTSNNKVTRIKLGERLGLPPLTEHTKLSEKHYCATCPPYNSSLQTRISNNVCLVDSKLTEDAVTQFLGPEFEIVARIEPHSGLSEVIISPKADHVQKLTPKTKNMIYNHLHQALDGHQIPVHILLLDETIPRTNQGLIDEMKLDQILKGNEMRTSDSSNISDMQSKVRDAMADVLGIPAHTIRPESDFFQLGGDSLSAGRLLSTLRRNYHIRIPIHQLFASSTVRDLSALADGLNTTQDTQPTLPRNPENTNAPEKLYSSTNLIVLFINLLPITLFIPMKLSFLFTMFIYSLSLLSNHWRNPHIMARILSLITAIAIARLSTQVAAPVFGIMLKWIIIGRFKAGTYPMWGVYHTRWWIVHKILLVCGKGIFKYSNASRALYYRALGARIGSGVIIEKGTNLGEYDLLDIDDNVHLDRCICRPFACERNTTMLLDRIHIGRNSSIGLKSYVAAGSFVPADTYIRPNSSSYEINNSADDYRGKTNGKLPEPHLLSRLFLIFPLQIIVLFISSLPWMIALLGVASSKPTGNSHRGVLSIIHWWAAPRRIVFHYLAVAVHALMSPIVRFVVIVIIKRCLDKIFGKPLGRKISSLSQLEILRMALIDSLEPSKSLQSVTKIFGSHYEATSIAARALGARVGNRVYWPGTGPVIQDFDLLEIGNDVVFGSRSYLVTRDGHGLASIKIGAGSMIADRVILSPGTVVGNRAVMGSGAMTRRGQVCDPDSVWIGNKNGGAVCLSQTKFAESGHKFRYAGPVMIEGNVEAFKERKQTCHVSEKETDIHCSRYADSEKQMINGKSISRINSCSTSPGLESSITNDFDNNTVSPFGRAFYGHQAPYHIITLPTIVLYTTVTIISTRILWDLSTLINLFLSHIASRTNLLVLRPSRSFIIYGVTVCLLSGTLILLSAFAILIVISAKWIIMGRRRPGNFDWDKSSYCQRWQLYLTIEGIRAHCFGRNGVLDVLTGSFFMVLYYRLLGAHIGSNTAIFASGPPSAYFTEPDLLVIGDRVTIDDASLVSHINSRGKFDLRTLEVADRAVLRSGSRLLSGSSMGQDSILLEHTLIMAGDRADEGVVYQGWPAEVFSGAMMYRGTQEGP